MSDNEEIPIKENIEQEEEILSIPPEDIVDMNNTPENEKLRCDFIIKEQSH